MPRIELTTIISAPITRCFQLARSIDMHKLSTSGTHEEAISGVTKGLIGKGQTVTWRARHFGIRQTLTSQITRFEFPNYFRDEMTKGAFRMIKHDHFFITSGDKTIMTDKFSFESPGWIMGSLLNTIVLKRYLRNLLIRRNGVIKQVAENGQWKTILSAAGDEDANT